MQSNREHNAWEDAVHDAQGSEPPLPLAPPASLHTQQQRKSGHPPITDPPATPATLPTLTPSTHLRVEQAQLEVVHRVDRHAQLRRHDLQQQRVVVRGGTGGTGTSASARASATAGSRGVGGGAQLRLHFGGLARGGAMVRARVRCEEHANRARRPPPVAGCRHADAPARAPGASPC